MIAYFRFLLRNGRRVGFGFSTSFFSSFGQTFFIALFVPFFLLDLELTAGTFGAIYSLATLGSALLLPFIGALYDRTPLNRYCTAIVLGLGVACLLVASAWNVWLLALGLWGLRLCGQEALKNPAVKSLLVVEVLEPVIEWHRQGLVPLGEILISDPRCRIVQGDFFAAVTDPEKGLDPTRPGRRFHAILLDIDHTPNLLLHESHGAFYRPGGLRQMAAHLHPEGVFSMWSDGGVDVPFLESLRTVFPGAEGRRVSFHNPLQDRESSSTVYIARKASGGEGR